MFIKNSTRSLVSNVAFLFALVASTVFAAPLFPSVAHASGSACSSEDTVINIVAHQDDSLLFQSPDLFHDVQSGHCTLTIFTTAGDAGAGPDYWLSREAGARAAYADMAGLASTSPWTESDAGIAGHPIPVFTLDGHPNVSMAFLRLPDGGVDGNGLAYPVSLKKLWEGSISSLTAIDDSSSYTKQGLIDTLAAFYTKYQPSRINSQNFVAAFGDVDHSDHIATGYFSKGAHDVYTTPHTIYAYRGYDSVFDIANVFGDDLAAKVHAFFAYTPFDLDACGQNLEQCTGSYDDWLNRQYIAGSETGGVSDVCPNIAGDQRTVPDGYQLVAGQCVPTTQVCQSIVSDTSDMVSVTEHAVATYTSPEWTANIPGATWIWNAFHVADPANGETVTFTKDITATGTISAASIVVGADDFFTGSLNGVQFGQSEEFTNYVAGHEHTYDLTPLLHTGTNTLSFTVVNIPTGDTDPEMNPAGLRYKLDIVKNTCDEAPVVTPPPSDGGDNTGGGGGGYTPPKLKISGQMTKRAPSSGSVIVSWTTSRAAYGHVIYGIDTGTPYTLDLTKANFGYPTSVPTDPSLASHLDPQGKVKIHAFTLSNLIPGKKYRYRIVSHASPAVTTDEGTFIAPMPGDTSSSDLSSAYGSELAISDEIGGSDTAAVQQSSGSTSAATPTIQTAAQTEQTDQELSPTNTDTVEDTATTTASTSTTDTDDDTATKNTAAAFASGGIKLWHIGLLVAALLAVIGWYIFGRKDDKGTN